MNKALIYGLLLSILMVTAPHAGHQLLILLTTLKFMELRSACDATVLVIVTAWVHLYAQQALALKPRSRIAATLLLQAIPLTAGIVHPVLARAGAAVGLAAGRLRQQRAGR